MLQGVWKAALRFDRSARLRSADFPEHSSFRFARQRFRRYSFRSRSDWKHCPVLNSVQYRSDQFR